MCFNEFCWIPLLKNCTLSRVQKISNISIIDFRLKIYIIMDSLAAISTSTIILALAIIALAYIVYVKLIKLYCQYNSFSKLVSSKYITLTEPFYFFIPNIIWNFTRDLRKFGDSLHSYKRRSHQVVLYLFGPKIGVMINNDSALAKEYFQNVALGYYKKSLNFSFTQGIKHIAGNGLLFSQGNDWKMKRKIMSTVFNYEFIKQKIPTISRITKEFLDKIEKTPQNKGKNQIKMNLCPVLEQIFGNIVIKCFFGDISLVDIKGQSVFTFFRELLNLNNQRSLSVYAMLISNFIELNLRPVDKKVTNMVKQFNQYAQTVIRSNIKQLISNKQRKSQIQSHQNEKGGIIQRLIKQQKLKTQQIADVQGQKKDYYTPAMLVDEFKTFFLAGTQTTANSTTILLYVLSKHKDFQERVRKQIDAVFGDDIENITIDKLKQLKELQKCLKEILRMHSPAPEFFVRQALNDHYLGEIPIKKGTLVTLGILSRHFSQKFYENPHVFNPDRWDSIDPKKVDPYYYLAFGLGQRSCIGQQLASIQGKIALIHILKRYKEIKPQKPEFRRVIITTYTAQTMTTTFVK